MSTLEARDTTSGWTVWRRNIIEAVPRLARRRDTTLPLIVAVSLLVHGGALLALFWTPSPDTAPRPKEIQVELVQAPPEAKTPPPPPKPPEKQAAKEARKPPPPAPKPAPKPPKPAQESASDRLKDLLGPIPPGLAAAALPGETQDGSEQVGYSRVVMSRIAKAKKEGRYPGTPGYATVEFVLGDGGEVTRLDLRRPSGDPSLDTEAVELVKRAEPYPPPPPGGRRDFVVTLEFRPVP